MENESLQNSVQRFSSENQKLTQLELKLSQISPDLLKKDQEISRLNSLLQDSSMQLTFFKDKEETAKRDWSEIDSLRDKLTLLSSENERLRFELERTRRTSGQKAQEAGELPAIKGQNRLLLLENEKLKEELERKTKEFIEKQSETFSLSTTVMLQNRQIDELRSSLKNRESEVERMNNGSFDKRNNQREIREKSSGVVRRHGGNSRGNEEKGAFELNGFEKLDDNDWGAGYTGNYSMIQGAQEENRRLGREVEMLRGQIDEMGRNNRVLEQEMVEIKDHLTFSPKGHSSLVLERGENGLFGTWRGLKNAMEGVIRDYELLKNKPEDSNAKNILEMSKINSSQLEKRAREAEANNRALSERINRMADEMTNISKNCESRIDTLGQELVKAAKAKQEVERELEKAIEDLNWYKNNDKSRQLEASIRQIERDKGDLEEELKTKEQENDKLREKLKQKQNEKQGPSEFASLIRELVEEKEQLAVALYKSEQGNIEKDLKIKELRGRMSVLENECSVLVPKLHETVKKIGKIGQSEDKDDGSSSSLIVSMKAELKNVQVSLMNKEAELQRAMSQIQELNEELKDIGKGEKKISMEADRRLKEMDKRAKMLQKELEEVKRGRETANESQRGLVEKEREVSGKLKMKVAELEERLRQTGQNEQQLQNDLENLSQTVTRLQKTNSSVKTEKTKIQKELESVLAEKKSLEGKIKERNQQISDVNAKYNEIYGKFSALTKENSRINGRIQDLESALSRIDELETENGQLRDSLEEKNKDLESCFEEMTASESEKSQLKSALSSFRNDLDEREAELLQLKQKMEATGDLKGVIETQEGRIKLLSSENGKLRKKSQDTIEELNRTKQILNDQIQELIKTKNEMGEQMQEMVQKMTEFQQRDYQLESENSEMKEKQSHFLRVNDELSQNAKELMEKVAKLEKKVEKWKRRYSDLNKGYQAWEEEREEVIEEQQRFKSLSEQRETQLRERTKDFNKVIQRYFLVLLELERITGEKS